MLKHTTIPKVVPGLSRKHISRLVGDFPTKIFFSTLTEAGHLHDAQSPEEELYFIFG
jgi:hypothetical protein